MREKFQHFMQGRYGADQLSRFLTTIGLVLIILNLFVRSNAITYLVMALLVYCYYRICAGSCPVGLCLLPDVFQGL